jgi:hypothetical protein
MDDGGRLRVPNFTDPVEEEVLDLNAISADLGEVYFIEKDAKTERERLRGEFFKAATATFSPERLAQKTVIPPPDVQTEEASRAYAELYNTGWTVVEYRPGQVVIREDPSLKPYQKIIEIEGGVKDGKGQEHPGYSISRSITGGSLSLDEERISTLDPELYERVTQVAYYDTLARLLYDLSVNPDDIDRRLNSSNLPRVLRSLDDLDDKDREAVKQYTYESARSAKLLVRYAKEEEIGAG